MADTDTQKAAEALATTAATVSGPDTPANAHVTSAPSKGVALTLILAGPALSVMLIALVCLLSFWYWPWLMRAGWRAWPMAGDIIKILGGVSISLCVLLGVALFRLASGGLKSIRAQALSGSIEIQTGDKDELTEPSRRR